MLRMLQFRFARDEALSDEGKRQRIPGEATFVIIYLQQVADE